MLHIVLWKWTQKGFREKYTSEHVNIMAAMIARNFKHIPYRVICITDNAEGIDDTVQTFPLWSDFKDMHNASGVHLPSCYRRLRLFDPATQDSLGIRMGERIVSIDLDTVIVGSLNGLFSRGERFVGWAVRGTRHIRVFNGSFFMFNAGDLDIVWTNFDPETSPQLAQKAGYFGSDQSWMSYMLSKRTDCAGWSYPVIASYPREVARRPLPKGCSIVFFHGKRKPWHPNVQAESRWILQNWMIPQPLKEAVNA